VALQDDNDAYYCVVDLHALTVETDPKLLQKRTLLSAAQLIAIGIDPGKSTLFVQSQVPAHNQLAWVFECITGFGEASRMTQFKDKSQKGGAERTNVGLFTYPILQAADILLYQPDFVPVGEDQRQHIELTRDIAERFNKKFGKVFNIPQAQIIKSLAKINDLQDPTAKMSKSATSMAGVIEILDTPEVILKKFKSSVTDNDKEIKFDEKLKPGISNLLTIHSALSGKSVKEVEIEFSGKGYGDFKVAVAEVVIEALKPIAKRTDELMSDKSGLIKILQDGSEQASQVASATLKEAYKAVGIM
jgi:tryptophanyl-tRNA synthetase